ncbi:MAG: tRNA (5-methylaminomethyl-2-thiouridine)(34)-methyltransferase MnmD [Crocinitomicaceae bacterium]|nr:tRNA (5-methylaminomethyl-2-thiouridine)(34)-methyltransferase MnmD [Crocinitomicaceae bacterium]
MKREFIKTEDGSMTIYLPEMDETYHSTHGAIQEAEHVFIKHGLNAVDSSEKLDVNVFEVGFGTGLNALLSMKHSRHLYLNYDTIEAFPVTKDEADKMRYCELVGDDFKVYYDKMIRCPWGKKESLKFGMTFFKIHEKLQNYSLTKGKYDVIYFDAFGPRAQSEMWEIAILQNMFDGLQEGGMLVTYCAKGQFKRDLKSIGFEVESLPGPPGKREMTRAWKPETEEED